MTAEPVDRPFYKLMGDPLETAARIAALGADEFHRQVDAEIRLAMSETGARAALWYSQRMQDVTARMEELTD